MIIDIPETAYEAFKEWHKNNVANVAESLIANGIPYDEKPKYFPPCEDCNRKMEEIRQAYDKMKAMERPEGKWIPVSERLPDDLEPVNITWINHDPEPYYKEIKDKPFTATGVYFNGQWYWWSTLCTDILAEYSHNFDDIIDSAIEIIAWQPLPEPYEKGGADES